MKLFEKLSRLKHFVDLEKKNNVITVRSVTPLFTNLLNNVKNEYLKYHTFREANIQNIYIDSTGEKDIMDHAAYLHNPKFIDAFAKLKDNHELPFAVTEEIKEKNNLIECIGDENLHVIFPKRHLLRTSYFVSNSFSSESFHHMQRQHKIWWMKYGSYPGKYFISDQKNESLFKSVHIQSTVTESVLNIESFKLFSLKDCTQSKEIIGSFHSKLPNRKKEIIPDIIKSVVDLQVAAIALLFDAVNLTEYYTAHHRRIAPYQVAIIINGCQRNSKQLNDLSRYIELLINKTEPKIKVLNELTTRNYDTSELDKQYQTYDEIGIPYNIILDNDALNNGLFHLRNRNTTLSEKIHLSDVTNYLIKIFNSG